MPVARCITRAPDGATQRVHRGDVIGVGTALAVCCTYAASSQGRRRCGLVRTDMKERRFGLRQLLGHDSRRDSRAHGEAGGEKEAVRDSAAGAYSSTLSTPCMARNVCCSRNQATESRAAYPSSRALRGRDAVERSRQRSVGDTKTVPCTGE